MKKYILTVAISLCVLLFFLSIYAQNNNSPATNPKWDYKAITIYRSSSSGDGSWSQWFETSGDVQQQLPSPVTVTKRLRELGMQGWELVSVTPLSAATGGGGTSGYSDVAGFTTHVTYYLKRLQQ